MLPSKVVVVNPRARQASYLESRLLQIQIITTPHSLVAGYFFNEQGEAEPIWGQPLDPHTQRMHAQAQKFAPKPEETK
jgi:hypothetical protein